LASRTTSGDARRASRVARGVPRVRDDEQPGHRGDECTAFGTSTAFDAATLASLYPSQQKFLDEFDRSLARAVKERYLLDEEAAKLRAAVRAVPYPAP
jgi:Alpha/beta hydrolase domain